MQTLSSQYALCIYTILIRFCTILDADGKASVGLHTSFVPPTDINIIIMLSRSTNMYAFL